MNRRHILLGAILLAAVILGGLWLFLQQVPVTQGGLERKCIEAQRRVRSASIQPGSLEEHEAAMLAYCDCFAREVSRQLTKWELAAIGLKQSTPAIDAKLIAAIDQCRVEVP